MELVKGIILLLELGKARPLVGGLLMVAAGLGGGEVLLGRAEVLHDGIAGAGHSDHILQWIVAGDAGLQEVRGDEAAHGADAEAVGLLVAEDLADRAILARPGPLDPLGQCSFLGWTDLLLHLRITLLRRLLSSRQYISQAISRAAAGEVRGPSRLSMN